MISIHFMPVHGTTVNGASIDEMILARAESLLCKVLHDHHRLW
jgi:hypothetical protein